MDSLKAELFSYVDFFSELKFVKLEFQSKIEFIKLEFQLV